MKLNDYGISVIPRPLGSHRGRNGIQLTPATYDFICDKYPTDKYAYEIYCCGVFVCVYYKMDRHNYDEWMKEMTSQFRWARGIAEQRWKNRNKNEESPFAF